MDVSVTNYILPQSLEEALQLVSEHEDAWLVMGGGTVTMPLINEGISAPEQVMGLRKTGLNYIRPEENGLVIGATTTLSQILNEAPIPMLREAARNTAAWAIRNLATVGGNFFVPPPAGDLATALLALDAELKLVSRQGEHVVPVSGFYTGFMTNVLEDDEILAEIWVPMPEGQTAFIKYGRKEANTPAVVTVAAHIVSHNGQVSKARLALNAVGPHPFRAQKAEAVLEGSTLAENTIEAAAEAAAEECQPATDAIASEWYRRKMVKVFVGRALKQLTGEEG
jgi:CO/xanthine dehydrogenase FAD-binding subunit